MKSYGINERESAHGDIATHAERIRTVGYSVLETGFQHSEVLDLGHRLDAILDQQVKDFGGTARLALIGDASTVRCPLVYDAAFLTLVAYPQLLALVRQLLGEFVVLMQQNGIVNPTAEQHTQAAYHRDLPYQHFVSSRPLAISALFCIDPFRAETGATLVIPASQHLERFPSEDVAAALEVSVVAEPGSFVVFDSMLFHRAGVNRSPRVRRAVNQVYSVPIIAQQISLPAALEGRYAGDSELACLLGYGTSPAASVADWRDRRLGRRGGSRESI